MRWSHAHEIPTKSAFLDLEFESAVFRNFRLDNYTTTGMGQPGASVINWAPPSWRRQKSLSSWSGMESAELSYSRNREGT